MALNLTLTYPGQIASDSAYPYGKPRNRSDPDAKDGTPLEQSWVSDVYGFLQSLLVSSGIAPNGSSDTANASQYLQALQWNIDYKLSHLGEQGEHIYVLNGSWVSWLSGSHATVYSGATFTVGGTLAVEGLQQIKATGSWTALSGATLNWNLGSTATLAGDITVAPSCAIVIGGALTWGASNYPKLSSRSLSRSARSAWVTDANTELLFDSGSGAGQFWGTLLYQGAASLRESIESAATVTSVIVYVKGAAHGGSWPPAGGMPTLKLTKISQTSDDATVLGTKTDTSSQSAYEDWHPLVIGISSGGTFTGTEKLLITLTSEYGPSGVVAPLEFKDPVITMTFGELRAV